MVIDGAITNVANDDSGEGTSSKKAIVEIEAQAVEVQERSPKRESTLVKFRMEIGSLSRSLRPLILQKFIPLSPKMMKCPPQRSHHLKRLKIIQKVTLSVF